MTRGSMSGSTAVIALSCLIGCRADRTSVPTTAEKFDVYITWHEYDGFHNPERAAYVLNGRAMGRGPEGFRQVLNELQRLPAGSRVLVYPVGYWKEVRTRTPVSYYIPFLDMLVEFKTVVRDHKLEVIRSNEDHEGRRAWPRKGLAWEQSIFEG
jgi:hypothetical protein